MDTTTPLSVILYSGVLITAALVQRGAMSPPTSRVDPSYRVDPKLNKIVPFEAGIKMSFIANLLVGLHMALEVYALWATSEHPPLGLQVPGINNICPSTQSSQLPNIYPGSKIPLLTFAPLCLIIFGGLFRISCHLSLGKMFTWDTSILKDHKLVTTGPYSIVRHPAYTGFGIIIVGYTWFLYAPNTYMRECLMGSDHSPAFSAISIAYALWWTFLYTDAAIFMVRRSFTEDRMLKGEFGKEWDEWAKKVRWNVIPYVL